VRWGLRSFIWATFCRSGVNFGCWKVPVKIAGITSSPWLFARAVFKSPAMPAPPTRWLNCFDNTAVILTINSWLTKSAVPIALTFPISN